MCTPTEEHGLPKWSCVLQKCDDCGPIVIHDIETDVSEGAPIIQFNAYLKQGYFSTRGVLSTCITPYHTFDMTTELDDVTGKNNFCKETF